MLQKYETKRFMPNINQHQILYAYVQQDNAIAYTVEISTQVLWWVFPNYLINFSIRLHFRICLILQRLLKKRACIHIAYKVKTIMKR